MAKRSKRSSSLVLHLSGDQNNNHVPPQFGAGNFHKLPLEIIFMTLDQVDISSLGDVALASKTMHVLVCQYIQTAPGLIKLFHLWKYEVCSLHGSCFHKENAIIAAKFLRKLVLFMPCKAKISFISEILLKSRCMWNKDCFQQNLFFGNFVQVLLQGWTESEIQLAHDIVDQKSGRLDDLNAVLVAKEGSMPKEEIEVRLYYRSVYWSAVKGSCKRAKWLNLVLKAQPYCFQSKILLLLFAPVNADGNIMWDIFTSDQAPEFRITLMQAIAEMADVLGVLHLNDETSLDVIMTLIDEISAFTVQWTQRNICQFILYCGLDILQYVLRGYLIGLQYEEFMDFMSMCTSLPICQTQASVFAEIICRAVDWPEISPTAHASFLIYFYAFIDRCAGNFHKLPLEIIFMTLDQVDISSLGDVALASKTMHVLVCQYIQTAPGLKKLFNLWKYEVCSLHGRCFHKENAIIAAKFLRKLVLFMPCKAKISFISEILLKSRCMWNKDCFQQNLFFGNFVQVLLQGWTESEIQLAHDIVDQKSGRLDDLNAVLVAKEGSMPKEEIEVRLYYRSVYWSAVKGSCKRAKWLNLVLKAQPYCFQSKILLLLFAPVNADGNIMWDIFTSDQAPEFRITLMQAIAEMADVLGVLHLNDETSLDVIMTLIDEISAFTVQWTQRNICQFILYCGLDILQYVLRGYLIGLQYEEFMDFMSMCTSLPICQTQASVFAEIICRAVDWPEISPTAHASFLIYFYAFIDRYKSIFVANEVMQVLLRMFRRRFPRRRSRRLASKACGNKRSNKRMH